MRFWGLATCDTCRKALKSLTEAGFEPEVIDVGKHGLSATDIEEICANLGEAVVNKASTTFRGLSEDEKALSVKELLFAHPKALKRPVIEANGQWSIGWKADVQSLWLK